MYHELLTDPSSITYVTIMWPSHDHHASNTWQTPDQHTKLSVTSWWPTLMPTSLKMQLQLGCSSKINTHKINLLTIQKGYGNSETTHRKLLARRIQICLVQFCVIHFWPFFKITSKIMSEHHWTKQNQIRLVKYSFFKVSGPSEVCVCNWPTAVWDSRSLPI